MKNTLSFLLCMAIFHNLFSQSQGNVPTLVQAERNFAASAVNGTKAAFLGVLDKQSILFRPLPVPGRQATEAGPNSAGLLSWYPEFAETASSGELGFTTGPFEFREAPADLRPVSTGHFVSVWKKDSLGTWKLKLDIGIQHPPVLPAAALDFAQARDVTNTSSQNVAHNSNDLLEIDKAFGSSLLHHSWAEAFPAFMAKDMRLYSPGLAPILGAKAILALVASKNVAITQHTTMGAEVSISNDFGYTYGTYSTKAQQKNDSQFSYARIWRKDTSGAWKIILDISNQVPAS